MKKTYLFIALAGFMFGIAVAGPGPGQCIMLCLDGPMCGVCGGHAECCGPCTRIGNPDGCSLMGNCPWCPLIEDRGRLKSCTCPDGEPS